MDARLAEVCGRYELPTTRYPTPAEIDALPLDQLQALNDELTVLIGQSGR